MMTNDKSQRLVRAASLSFALTGMFPLLTFAYTLLRLNGLKGLEDQVTLGLTLMTALLGFRILRVVVTRISTLTQCTSTPTEQGQVRVPGIGMI